MLLDLINNYWQTSYKKFHIAPESYSQTTLHYIMSRLQRENFTFTTKAENLANLAESVKNAIILDQVS